MRSFTRMRSTCRKLRSAINPPPQFPPLLGRRAPAMGPLPYASYRPTAGPGTRGGLVSIACPAGRYATEMDGLFRRSVASFGFDFLAQGDEKVLEGLGAEVALAAVAHRDRASIGFLAADHEHVGHLLELCVADFSLQFFVAVVQVRAEASGGKRCSDFAGVVEELFADGQHLRLHRCEPCGERTSVVLEEDAKEALDRAPQRAMHHERLVPAAVFADVFQAEARRQVEIKLHGGELPGPADGVNQ